MTKESFLQLVADKVEQSSPVSGVSISWDVFTKNNNTKRYGIVVRQMKDTSVFPTVYVDHFFEDYLRKKKTIDEIASEIWDVIAGIQEDKKKYHDFSVRWEDCENSIYYRLVSYEKNRDLLNKIPYVPFLDLAITFGMVCGRSERGVETLLINNQLMEFWGVSTSELFRLSEKNTPELFPYHRISLIRMLYQYLGTEEEEAEETADSRPMQVLSNVSGVNGAAVILYPGVIEELAKEFDSDLFILPSSIHEVIVLPGTGENTSEELTSIVREINEKHVSREEILSDHAYFYDRESRKFII